MDERKVRIYTWMVKTGKWTIDNVPSEYQEAVTNNLPNMNIVDLDKITELEMQYNLLSETTALMNDDLGNFVSWVVDTLDSMT